MLAGKKCQPKYKNNEKTESLKVYNSDIYKPIYLSDRLNLENSYFVELFEVPSTILNFL